ncbi:MAG: ABC transporter permease [Bacteroidetes bacterium]|nr:ABC transporter permease [Bacteroidota bacterium]MBS1973965.1 ABC transporter permease [Bacteroidota bacterium]
MKKTWLVIQREYLTRVKRRSFLITTLIVPIIIIGFYAAIIAISISGSTSSQKIALIDDGHLFNGQVDKAKDDLSQYAFIQGETEDSFKSKYKTLGYSAFLYVPKINIDAPYGIRIHSQSALSLSDKGKIESTVNRAIEDKRLASAQIDPAKYKAINADVSIENTIDSENGEKKAVAGVAYAVSFGGGILIYMILLIYGMMVMRGVMEEKVNRIAEVIVSSVKPFQLMLGKIIGIGAVGLTQFSIWIVLMILLQALVPLLFPGMFHQVTANPAVAQAGQTGQPNMMIVVAEGLKSLPIGLILFCFVFYFLGGYLIYASMFAAIGSAVSEDQQEAQQLTFPIMMPIILAFVIMTKAVNDPNSGLAIFGSLFPLTSPIVMMGRIAYSPPAWQIILSMAFLILGFLFFTWLTAKIYRTGILMYGKKITWKEMIKWAFRKG